jgi:CelD/BcsL family acetyltransferase involved in cellulose biosynthesis
MEAVAGEVRPDARATALTSHVVDNDDELLAIRADWDQLQASAAPVGPFTSWAWVWHWWRICGDTRDRLHVLVFRDSEGLLRGALPLVLTTWGRGPLSFRALRMYGWDAIELREPVVAVGWEHAVADGLSQFLSANEHQYDWCMVRGIPRTGPIATWLRSSADEYEGTVYHVVDLPSSWEELRARLKRSMKKTLGHSYNTLSREGRAYSFEVVDDPSRMPAALDDFFRLHAARASVCSNAVAHPNHYRTEQRRQLLRSVAADLPHSSRLLVCRLHVDGNLVACRLAFPVGKTLYLYDSGFDPAWWWYGVPTTTTAECMKMAITSGFDSVNLSTGTDYSKTRWRPEARSLASWGIVAPSARARLYVGLAVEMLQMRDAAGRYWRELVTRGRSAAGRQRYSQANSGG